jgi:uroporphyrinogen decarboxylase
MMTPNNMTSLQRVLTTLSHEEPDRVPFFLLVTMHGARELGMSIEEYFSKGEYVAEGQLRLQARYGHDCLYTFFYAPIEVEAWGGEVVFIENGPPNSGSPIIQNSKEIERLEPPIIEDSACLLKVLETTRLLKSEVGDRLPIIGVVMSPFSLPVMQMGFESYIELIYEQPELFYQLMQVNERVCIQWANAQIEAGATAICYFDPVSSTSIIPRDLYLKTGFQVAKRTIAEIKGPTATHMASGNCLPIVNDIARTGTAIIGVSSKEDLAEVKAACQPGLTVLGNLNGIEMRRWSLEETEAEIKSAIAKAGPGGGFILSDNHGEIPWQVPDEALAALSQAVLKWGNYPLDWIR